MKNDKYSSTALLIAKAQVFLSEDDKYSDLVSAETLKWSLRFIETASGRKNYDKLCRNKYYRWFVRIYERIVLPGILKHYLLRKHFIEKQVLQILNQGEVNRVVILAGGFDTLALRLSEKYPDIEFIELDHPATQKVKRQSLAGYAPNNLKFRAIDYNKKQLNKILDVQKESGTLFIAEGILMYLGESEVKSILKDMSRVSPDNRKIIFSYLTPVKNKKNALVKSWLKFKKETLSWTITEEELPSFLGEVFQKIEKNVTSIDLQEELNRDLTDDQINPVLGENLCVASN